MFFLPNILSFYLLYEKDIYLLIFNEMPLSNTGIKSSLVYFI